MDAVDAERYLGDLSLIFAGGSLVAILFFIRRANAVSVALVGWWVCYMVAFFVTAPDTISGRQDVVTWANEIGWAGFAGLFTGGWLGSRVGRPRSSARFLTGCAIVGATTGVALVVAVWHLSQAMCQGPGGGAHLRHGDELDTTFCPMNTILGRWNAVYVASVVLVFLLAAASARRCEREGTGEHVRA